MNLFNILNREQKKNFLFFVFLVFLSTILEIFGIYLVIPVSDIIFDINYNSQIFLISDFVEIKFYFNNHYKFIIVFLFVMIFTLKLF